MRTELSGTGGRLMTNREAGSLAFKLAGIYVAVTCLLQIQMLMVFVSAVTRDYGAAGLGGWVGVIASFLQFALLAALAYVLLVHSNKLSGRMFGDTDEKVVISASARDIQAIAFSVVGIFLFVSALPHIMQIAANLAWAAEDPGWRRRMMAGTLAASIEAFIKLILGLYLFFSGRTLSNIWFKLRTAGHPRMVEAQSSESSSSDKQTEA